MYRQLQEYICDTALKRMHNFYFHGKVDLLHFHDYIHGRYNLAQMESVYYPYILLDNYQ